MHEDSINQVRKAVDESMAWATSGWKVSFGERGSEVNSLHQARSLPENFVHREVARDYWNHVAQTGEEAAAYGRKAIEALNKNDLKAAEDILYFCWYLEKEFSDYTRTWKQVYEAVKKQLSDNSSC